MVTDGTAAVTARESFDAWGKQRNEDGTDDATCSNGLTSPTTRGFTSQEEIAALCLVNLNARIYDPTIGRFMAADTIVPDPYDGTELQPIHLHRQPAALAHRSDGA